MPTHQLGLFWATRVVEVVVLAPMWCQTPHPSHQVLTAMETWEMGAWGEMTGEVGLA